MTKRPSLSGNVKPSKLAESMKVVAQETSPDLEALAETTQAVNRSSEPKLSAKRYEGMKKMLIPLDPSDHRKLKMMAVERDMTLERIVQEAVKKYLLSSD